MTTSCEAALTSNRLQQVHRIASRGFRPSQFVAHRSRLAYAQGISKAVADLDQYKEAAGHWISRMQHWELSDDAANSYMLQSFERGVIGIRLLPLILREWRQPRLEDYRPRTGWSLWNCFTDVIGRTRQQASPAEAALSTIRLQKLLTPPLTLDAQVSPPSEIDTSEEGNGLPVSLATVE